MGPKQQTPKNPNVDPEAPHPRNAARAAVLSGRHRVKIYTTPLDTQHFLTKEQFEDRYIRNKPDNPYTGSRNIVEVRNDSSVPSPVTPITPASATTAASTQTNETITSKATSHEEDTTPTGWYSKPC
jgi:hypothetical protein